MEVIYGVLQIIIHPTSIPKLRHKPKFLLRFKNVLFIEHPKVFHTLGAFNCETLLQFSLKKIDSKSSYLTEYSLSKMSDIMTRYEIHFIRIIILNDVLGLIARCGERVWA